MHLPWTKETEGNDGFWVQERGQGWFLLAAIAQNLKKLAKLRPKTIQKEAIASSEPPRSRKMVRSELRFGGDEAAVATHYGVGSSRRKPTRAVDMA